MDDPLQTATLLNRHCFCVGTDVTALQDWLQQDLAALGLREPIVRSHPHLFSSLPVFVSRQQLEQMAQIISAVESVSRLPGYRAAALADAPLLAGIDCAAAGGILAYDFHLSDAGASLIEVNTNAGGFLLAGEMLRAQRACCESVRQLTGEPDGTELAHEFTLEVFGNEWRAARGDAPLRRIAIVDEAPEQQYLYPEFLMYRRLFESAGLVAVIADVGRLELECGRAMLDGLPIDLIYNRSTDFYLQGAASSALRRIYESGAAVVTPHPRAYAIHADKRNLVRLTDPETLRAVGAADDVRRCLIEGIPRTRLVAAEDADELWQHRRQWFFKPRSGYGSRGAYRGDKLTRRVFDRIIRSDYVAQRIAPPTLRSAVPGAAGDSLKVDLRNYAYQGRVLLRAARLYQGQTTNFRTPGGGFAPVFAEPAGDPCLPRPAESPALDA